MPSENELTAALTAGTEFEDIHETPISPQQYSPAQSPLQQQQQPAKKGRPRKRKIEADHELQSLQGGFFFGDSLFYYKAIPSILEPLGNERNDK